MNDSIRMYERLYTLQTILTWLEDVQTVQGIDTIEEAYEILHDDITKGKLELSRNGGFLTLLPKFTKDQN